MFTIVTEYVDPSRDITAYQVEEEEFAIRLARNTAQWPNVKKTTLFRPNPTGGALETVEVYSYDQDATFGTPEENRRENVREIRDHAWKEGYEACRRGEQKHSPYRRH